MAVHRIIVFAMKTKQQVDVAIVDDLERVIREFQALYNKPE